MNKTQEKKVEWIRNNVVNEFSFGKDGYELKQFEIREYPTFVAVVAEVGMVNDEGTMAAVFCRNRVHVYVGKRGGLSYPATNKRTGKYIERPFKSLWRTYYEQEYC